jgi:UDP-N-acetyl-2-amino-2-deoxyglucuronate dehydrogenase
MSDLRIGIIGVGMIGKRHVEHVHDLAVLEAVCDVKREVAGETAEKYHCRAYTSIDDFLREEKAIELVSICTPNGLHKEHTVKALHAGKHVLCEKPMALSVRDCEQMILEAERMNRRLFIVKQNRFNPPVQALKRLLEEGRLGRILSVQLNCYWNRDERYYRQSDWKGSKSMDGGILFTQFSHFIDLIYWLVGDVDKVFALRGNLNHAGLIEFEDTGVVALSFESGALGCIHFTINSYKKNMEGSITLFGEKGTVKIGGQYLNELEYQCIDSYDIGEMERSRPPNEYGHYVGSMSNHDKVYRNVIDVLRGEGSISTNALEGLKTVQIVEEIYRAAQKAGA